MRPLRGWAALLLLASLPFAPAEGRDVRTSGPIQVTALAVEETPQGFRGVHATVEVTVLAEGSGHVYVSTKPLAQTDMQGSARLAAQVAAATLGVDWRSQDYLVSFTSGSPVIGGPSAGGVMALALTVALHNLLDPGNPWTLDPKVAGTGTINPDGTIGPVGGIPAKAEAAKAAGVTTFLYPSGLDVATTEVAGTFGPRQVAVDMAAHCKGLGIACRPAARLEELVSAAAHVDLRPRDVPVPGTGDYADILRPSVDAAIAQLGLRIDALRGDAGFAALRGSDRTAIEGEVQAAEARRKAAQEARAGEAFYRAATEAFQGSMAVGRAENLTRFVQGLRAQSVVQEALAGCQSAVAGVAGLANATASDYNGLYALGAAQERLRHALSLVDEARGAARDRTVAAWVRSLEASVFCTERARTVAWWADLRDAFPAGPALEDAAATAEQAIVDARDLLTYAQAVLAATGTSPHLQEAAARLQAAQAAFAAGQHPAATVQAVEASSLASVAVQAATGTVSQEVLEAAQQGAARAIAQARARGIEPMSAVSLVELAQAQGDPAAALHSYWTARSLALLDVVAPEGVAAAPPAAAGSGAALAAPPSAAMLWLVAGAALASWGLVLVALVGRRR